MEHCPVAMSACKSGGFLGKYGANFSKLPSNLRRMADIILLHRTTGAVLVV